MENVKTGEKNLPQPCLCSEQWRPALADVEWKWYCSRQTAAVKGLSDWGHTTAKTLHYNWPDLQPATTVRGAVVCMDNYQGFRMRTQHERPSPQQTQQSADFDSAKMSSTLLISCSLIIIVCTVARVCLSVFVSNCPVCECLHSRYL